MSQLKSATAPSQIRRYVLLLLVAWTLAVLASLAWNFYAAHLDAIARAETKAATAVSFNREYRIWAASHGGVYAPVTDTTPPNPYLSHLKERDLTTPSGRALTLINPAYMTRQVFEMTNAENDTYGHITSLNPIRKNNAPDAWERNALQTLELGGTQVSSVEEFKGKTVLRLMKPLPTKQSCLKCHAVQGYKVGDIRGGISFSVPLAPFRATVWTYTVPAMVGHVVFWVLGVVAIGWGGRSIHRREQERKQSVFAIHESENRLQSVFRVAPTGIGVVINRVLASANERLCDMTGYSKQELVGQSARMLYQNDEDFDDVGREKYKQIGDHGTGTVETHWVCKDGQIIDVLLSSTPMNLDDLSQGVTFTALDITERKQLEVALESRIVALTQPLDSVTPVSFEDLFNIDDIQDIQDSFAQATGVASIITHTDGTPITQPSNFCRLCQEIIRKTDIGRENCFKSDAALGCHHPNGPIIELCHSGGLWDAGASITVGGKHIANWLIGQVRDETQTEDRIREYAREIRTDVEEAVKAFHEAPAMSREQFEKIAQSLFTLANQLSTIAYQNIQQARFITDRKQAQDALQEKEESLRATLDSIGDAVIATDIHGCITRMNPVAETLTAWPLDDARGKPLTDVFHIIHAHTREPSANPVEKVLATGEIVGLANHTALIARDGTEYQISDSGAPIRNAAGETVGVVLVFRDVTEEYAIQEQLRQAQKMEAVGQLAGGVAHDFNNLLQAILGYGEMALGETDENSSVREFVEQMMKAGGHAKTLTRQLLAFSRRQVLEMEALDLNGVITDLMKMIQRILGEHIGLDILPGHDLSTVRADRGQIGQILTNLCVNARDAMPEGGTITIETENIRIDEAYCKLHAEAKPGRFVLLSITDTGCGMDEKTTAHAFDPFFTTKETGKGTGLGLSTVYGLVKQHDGMIGIYSEPHKGTTFKIYLPVIERAAAVVGDKIEGPIPNGTETILLAEDNEMVRNVCANMLQQSGYTVLTACDGEDALRVFEEHQSKIDMAILDVVMPKLGGKKVFNRIREKHPTMRFLFASGYSMNAIHTNFVLHEGLSLIPKPYQRAQLLRKVRAVLDQT